MMKKIFTFLLLIVFFAGGVSAACEGDEYCDVEDDRYNTRTVFRADDFFYSGQYNDMFVIARNTGNVDLEDVSVSVSIPELGIWNKRSYYDIRDREALVKVFDFYIPADTLPGVYTLRSVISTPEYREVTHRYIEVI